MLWNTRKKSTNKDDSWEPFFQELFQPENIKRNQLNADRVVEEYEKVGTSERNAPQSPQRTVLGGAVGFSGVGQDKSIQGANSGKQKVFFKHFTIPDGNRSIEVKVSRPDWYDEENPSLRESSEEKWKRWALGGNKEDCPSEIREFGGWELTEKAIVDGQLHCTWRAEYKPYYRTDDISCEYSGVPVRKEDVAYVEITHKIPLTRAMGSKKPYDFPNNACKDPGKNPYEPGFAHEGYYNKEARGGGTTYKKIP